MRRLYLALALVGVAFCQEGQKVNQSGSWPPDNYVDQYFYSGSNLTYDCRAQALQPPTVFYVSSSTLTNVVVSSNVGTINFAATFNGWVGMRVTLAGSATTALNKTYSVTAVSGSTSTITTSGVSDGTYNDSTLTLTTTAPLLNATVWAIKAFKYDGSSNLISAFWAGNPGVQIPGLACSTRSTY